MENKNIQEQEEIKQEGSSSETESNHGSKKLKHELNKVKEQLSDLAKQIIEKTSAIVQKEKIIAEKDLANMALKQELSTINEQYKQQLTAKMDAANNMVHEKIAAREQHLKQEFDNYKKYAIKDKALDLIEVISQLELACKQKLTDEKLINYQKGFSMILMMFQKLLAEWKITIISPKIGEEFDSNIMECFDLITEGEHKDNSVIEIISDGYKLHDQILKPALVKVFKKQ